MALYIRPYLKSRGKRKIVLTNSDIKFMHEDIILEEIKISEITDIKKTFHDIYHKSQNLKYYEILGLYVIFPLIVIVTNSYYLLFIIPFFHIFLVISKYIFHKIKYKNYKYRFFDAVMIYSGDKFINILPVTNKDYEKIKNYFLDKGFGDIQSKKIYFELMGHSFERITLERVN